MTITGTTGQTTPEPTGTTPAGETPRPVRPGLLAGEVAGEIPVLAATTDPAALATRAGAGTLRRVMLGRFGDTWRRAVFTNNGHTRIGFTAHSDAETFWVSLADPDLDLTPVHDTYTLDGITAPVVAEADTLAADADRVRPWHGPFPTRRVAEAFLLGRADSTLVTLTPAARDEQRQQELLDLLGADAVNGIGYAVFGDGTRGLDHRPLLAAADLDSQGCVVVATDQEGITFACGLCEHHEDHVTGYSFDAAGLRAWHYDYIGR